MKTIHFALGISAIAITFFFASCLKENVNPNGVVKAPETAAKAVVAPLLLDQTTSPKWKSGNAVFEVNLAAPTMGKVVPTFALKVDNWGENNMNMNGNYSLPNAAPGSAAANVITITNSTSHTFTWSSPMKVNMIIVKGGNAANVYYYPGGACSDTEYWAPVNASGSPAAISHVTFGWEDNPCDTEIPTCYKNETAWVTGNRYNTKGNWATYTSYNGATNSVNGTGSNTVNIFAGQTMNAGTAAFANNGNGTVNVTISLNTLFSFYYDLTSSTTNNNLKIMHYSSAPSGNPAPGQFAHKFSVGVGVKTYVATLPLANFYGIHLDVMKSIDCPTVGAN